MRSERSSPAVYHPDGPASRPLPGRFHRGWVAVSHGHEHPRGRRNPRSGRHFGLHGLRDGDGDRAWPPDGRRVLGEVMARLSPPLEIQEVEGDAVFALGPDRHPVLLPPACSTCCRTPSPRSGRGSAAAADESCACRACRSVGSLDLKIIAHHGKFLRQMVGSRSQAAGVNVVLAHRLLKNGLEGKPAYILPTEAALRWAGVDPDEARLFPHTERDEHFGEVRCFVRISARTRRVPWSRRTSRRWRTRSPTRTAAASIATCCRRGRRRSPPTRPSPRARAHA